MVTPKYKINAHRYLTGTFESILKDFLEEYYPGIEPNYDTSRYSLQYSSKIDAFQLELTLSELDLIFSFRIYAGSLNSYMEPEFKDFDAPDGIGLIDERSYRTMQESLRSHAKGLYNACRSLFFKYPESKTLYTDGRLVSDTLIVSDLDVFATSYKDPSGYVTTYSLPPKV